METLTEEKYLKLKRAAEEARTAADQAKGAHTQLMKQLKDNFDCDTLEDARDLLRKLEREEKAAEKELAGAMKKYEEDWERD